MLPIPGAKSTRKEDVSGLLFEALARERGEAAAAAVVPACRALNELRAFASEPPTTPEVRKALINYLSSLAFLDKEVGLREPLDRDLLWVSGFDASATATCNTLQLDRVAALFNLGVCESSLGVACYRQRDADPSALGRGAGHFTNAAACYKHAASLLPISGLTSDLTSDLTPECLAACEQLSLGNAQALQYVSATHNDPDGKFYENINARFAQSASHYYARAADKCGDARLSATSIRAFVGAPASALAGYYGAQAEMAQARICEKHCRMGEELARLKNARTSLERAREAEKRIDTSGLHYLEPVKRSISESTSKLDIEVTELQAKADKENIHVYFGVDPDRTTKPIAMREAASTDVGAVIAAVPLDSRLHPLKELPAPSSADLSGASSRYAKAAARTVASHVATLTTAAANLREVVVQADAALQGAAVAEAAAAAAAASNASKPIRAPGDIECLRTVRSAKEQGGLGELRRSYDKAIALSRETRDSIRGIEDTLAREEAEDRALRARMHVARPDSRTAAAVFIGKLSQSKADTEKAKNADEVVDAQIKHHEAALQALDRLDIAILADEDPKNGPGSGGVGGNPKSKSAALKAADDLRRLLQRCRATLTESASLTQELEQKQHLENPQAATARLTVSGGTGGVNDVEELVRASYADLASRSEALVARMQVDAAAVTRARAYLSSSAGAGGGAGAGAAARGDRAVEMAYRHQAAALKFDELRAFLADGERFYTNEQAALASLAMEVAAFARARADEAAAYGQYYAHPPPQHHPYHYAAQPPYWQDPNAGR